MEISCRVYRPRDPRKTPLFGLLDSLYDRVKGAWEERFERSYGFWRGLVDEVVARYLDCGIWQSGFARVRCRMRPEEFQTFGDRANFHPHVHALVSRGGWASSGEWIPVPYVDEGAAERLFRHKVLALLRRRGLLSQERIDLLLSWRRSGFSVHNRVYVAAEDGQGQEALVRYMMRPPVSLSRLRFTPGAHEVVYAGKGGHDEPEPTAGERIDAMEFVARVLVQIPDPRRQLLCSIDGGKEIRKALDDVFGDRAVIQRCQVHKQRNLREHPQTHMQFRRWPSTAEP